MTNTKEQFRQTVADFMQKHDMAPTAFGRWALKNPNFVSELDRPGYDPKLSTVNKVTLKMKNYKHKGNRHEDR